MEKTHSKNLMSLLYILGLSIPLFLTSCGPSVPEASPDMVQIKVMERLWTAHVRGLFLVDDQIAWASGSRGHFMRCTDGTSWTFDTIPGYSHLDFRDIHAFDAENALVMASGIEGIILRTSDGGATWSEVYANRNDDVFLDGMDFQGDHGYCYGDPINGKPLLIESNDAGHTWVEKSPDALPTMLDNEAGFAASGTGLQLIQNQIFIATGGGETARVFRSTDGISFQIAETNMLSEEGCGIFSISFKDTMTGVAVGGCYIDSSRAEGNCAITSDGGKSWKEINQKNPNGYRSCVAHSAKADFFLACGRTGIDFSADNGNTWTQLSDDGYFTCTLGEKTGWMMGRNGKLAKLTW
jgi:photosystem II stability/assembly factor-like uncharacterized protein